MNFLILDQAIITPISNLYTALLFYWAIRVRATSRPTYCVLARDENLRTSNLTLANSENPSFDTMYEVWHLPFSVFLK